MSSLPFEHAMDTTDRIVTQLAARALECRPVAGDIDVFVHRGCLTLTGVVMSSAERVDAERAVSPVPGVMVILNQIKIMPT